MEIDVTLVAGRRPELLERTLDSFARYVFPDFQISRVFANIDPFMGDAEDGEECSRIILKHFPHADISAPREAGFGLAVKNLWLKISAPYALHLEDDWIVLQRITPERVFPLFRNRVGMAAMFQPYDLRYRKHRRGGFKIREKRIPYTPVKRTVPSFTLSPCFVERNFAHEYAELLNPDLDPEGQNFKRNPELFKHCMRHRNAFIKGEDDPIVVMDIGRSYRAERGVVKRELKHGSCIWIQQNQKLYGKSGYDV